MRLREPALFYGVGIVNTLLDLGLFFLLNRALGFAYLLAQAISYTAGAANSYLLNRSLTFRRRRPPGAAEALRFAAVNAGSLGLTSLALYLGQEMDGSLFAAKLAATLLGAAVNYAGNRLWVFPDDGRPATRRAAAEVKTRRRATAADDGPASPAPARSLPWCMLVGSPTSADADPPAAPRERPTRRQGTR